MAALALSRSGERSDLERDKCNLLMGIDNKTLEDMVFQFVYILCFLLSLGTIHLRHQHVLGGRGVPMCRWSKGHST